MIFTSNFSKHGTDSRACSISLYPPKFYVGKQYKNLAPTFWILSKYKRDHDEDAYIKSYYSEVLSKLDPEKIYKELDGSILLCYEKKEDFCHRFLVADWLEYYLKIEVKELEK